MAFAVTDTTFDPCTIPESYILLQAFDWLEVMESTAHSIINAAAIDQIIHISDDEVADLKTAFNLVDEDA